MRLNSILFCLALCVSIPLVWIAHTLSAQPVIDPFEHGWTLDGATSTLGFTSVKNDLIGEHSQFTELSGQIDPQGQVRLSIDLETVQTGIDIRDVRLRFIFFETFLYRDAIVTTQLEAAALTALAQTPEVVLDLAFTLSLHGIEQAFDAKVRVTRQDFDRVAVRSTAPIIIPMDAFDLDAGRAQLESTASVEILPMIFVDFDLVFQRNARGTRPPRATATQITSTGAEMRPAECLARISALSRLGNIAFQEGSDQLRGQSTGTLDRLYDIASRCTDVRIEIGGHLDDAGSPNAQRSLSTRQAQAVADVMVERGIPADRLVVVGYGAARPIAPNTNAENRAQNRRIEFRMLN